MPSGYTDTLPDDVLLDVAVLTRKIGATPTPFGVSRGGITVTPTKENRNIEFDGKRADIAGLDRKTKHGITVEGTFIQFGAAQFADLEPGSTAVVAAPTTTITPGDASTMIAVDDLVDTLTVTYQRGNGGTAGYIIPKALCEEYSVVGQDNNEAEIKCKFAGRLDMSAGGATTDKSPYKIFITDPA